MKTTALTYLAVTTALVFSLCYATVTFDDESTPAGFSVSRPRRLKFGGACVADFDGDGEMDLLLGHHSRPAEIYFNNGNGTFTLNKEWAVHYDTHGLNAFRFNAWKKTLHFGLSRGGSNGNLLRGPHFYRVDEDRNVVDVSRRLGATDPAMAGRGRSMVILNLRKNYYSLPCALVLNGVNPKGLGPEFHHKALMGYGSVRMASKELFGFADEPNSFAMAADIDGDGRPEVISFHDLKIHKVVDDFTLKDISKTWLPQGVDFKGTSAVSAFDYNNDGLVDLYVARTNTGLLSWKKGGAIHDYLLKNTGSRFLDVSDQMGVPRGTQSLGVTTADFNNDGWTDVVITLDGPQDLVLLNDNRGKGPFKIHPLLDTKRAEGVPGNMATAVDYDRDGKVDIVLGEGHHVNSFLGGRFRILRNISTGKKFSNFIHVYVGNSPTGRATSLYAKVRVKVGPMWLTKFVGSPGTATSNSYIDILHFGLSFRNIATVVEVTWQDGVKQNKFGVKAGSMASFGILPRDM